MARKRYSDEDILKLLREIELKLADGSDVRSACRGVGVSDATYYTWRRRFGGMGRSQLSELRSLEKENARLKKICGGAGTGQADPQGKPELPKAEGLTASQLRQAVIHTRQKLATSERRTCKVVGLARSSMQYQAVEKNDDDLRLAVIRLAKNYGRYGYRKIAELLRIEGWQVNHKKVERLWREEGLQLPRRHKRKRRLYHKDSSIIRLRPKHPNHVWSVDFVHDKLSNGRSYKMLTVLDEYTRQALAVTVRTRMRSEDVLEVLYGLFLRHGKPEFVRSDNGPEFASQATRSWLEKVGVNPIRDLSGVTLGERVQRAVQWHSPPRGSQC